MSVLVDTSVWIRYLAGREPYAEEVARLLARDEVIGHELVFGELLIGNRGLRLPLLAAYSAMHQAETVPHAEVVALVRLRKLHGRGIGWLDAHLLASALVGRYSLYTADVRLDAVARALGVARKVP